MPRSEQHLDELARGFDAAVHGALGVLNSIIMFQHAPKTVQEFGADMVVGYFREAMYRVSGHVNALLIEDPEVGADAFEDYANVIAALSEGMEPICPEIERVVDFHLDAWYRIGQRPVRVYKDEPAGLALAA